MTLIYSLVALAALVVAALVALAIYRKNHPAGFNEHLQQAEDAVSKVGTTLDKTKADPPQ